MRVIIAGSRGLTDMGLLRLGFQRFVRRFERPTEIVSGGARGVDALGERLAKEKGIPVRRFPADWKAHGRAAGPVRNREMAEYADGLLALWDRKSRGTANMIHQAREMGLSALVIEVGPRTAGKHQEGA